MVLEDKLKQGEFHCIKNNKNQLLDLEDLKKNNVILNVNVKGIILVVDF